jgi:hypothetical protein
VKQLLRVDAYLTSGLVSQAAASVLRLDGGPSFARSVAEGEGWCPP